MVGKSKRNRTLSRLGSLLTSVPTAEVPTYEYDDFRAVLYGGHRIRRCFRVR